MRLHSTSVAAPSALYRSEIVHMGTHTSLADDAVAALSEVRRIGENMDNEHPLRHSIRDMKRTAENIIAEAMQNATNLAHQAQRLVKDYDESIRDSD